MKIIAVIPARYESSRFPGKPLAMIAGKSLLERSYQNALASSRFDEIIIATDDTRIASHASNFCQSVLMTSQSCKNGTERIIEILPQINADAIINLQGDEPCLPKEAIEACVQALYEGAEMASLVQIISAQEALNPSIVKCVMNQKGQALYFSRSPIPYQQKSHIQTRYYRHIGIYAYSVKFLHTYAQMPSSPLQESEDLEQLKVLEHAHSIQMKIVSGTGPGVDRPEDIQTVENYLCKQNTSS